MIQPTQSLKIQPKKVLTEDVKEIVARFNELVDAFVFQSSSISIDSNFSGYVIRNLTIDAGGKIQISHFLGVIPKWRIILRQTGNGVITDIPEEWTTKAISLKNNGPEDVTISILIVRE
jgi:hypothetical protein